MVEGGTTDPVLFTSSHLGLSGLVEREYGDTGVKWTLVGTDGDNNDNYVGLDRFGRIDDLVVVDYQTNVNRYRTEYNFLSAPVVEEDDVSQIYGYFCYDQTWTYDDLGRLVGHDRGRYQSPTTFDYTYRECSTLDRVGNESAYYGGTSSTCDYDNGRECEVNKSDEITSVTELSGGSGSPVYWDHDKTGSVTDRGTSDDLTYDAWNRLVEYAIDSTTWAEYRYNGLGQRIEDSYYAADGRYHLYSAEGEVIEDWDSDQQPPALVYWYASDTAGSIAVRADGETAADFEYQVPDARGNIVTRLDGSGDPAHRYIYHGYGEPTEVSLDWMTWSAVDEDLHLFRGQRYLSEIGHYDLGRTVGDPEFGRYLQRATSSTDELRAVKESQHLVSSSDENQLCTSLMPKSPGDTPDIIVDVFSFLWDQLEAPKMERYWKREKECERECPDECGAGKWYNLTGVFCTPYNNDVAALAKKTAEVQRDLALVEGIAGTATGRPTSAASLGLTIGNELGQKLTSDKSVPEEVVEAYNRLVGVLGGGDTVYYSWERYQCRYVTKCKTASGFTCTRKEWVRDFSTTQIVPGYCRKGGDEYNYDEVKAATKRAEDRIDKWNSIYMIEGPTP